MWIQAVLIFTIIKLSEQTCEMHKDIAFTETRMSQTTDKNGFYKMPITFYSYIVCSNISDDKELRSDIITAMNNITKYIEITNSNLPEITQDLFLSINLTELRIRRNNVQIIQEKAFESSNISTIILEDNIITKIKKRCFNSSSVYVLNLKNNSLINILADNFIGLTGLRKLSLQNNQIVDIEPDSFNDLTSLEELNLSFNKLNNIPTGLFKALTHLNTIFLNDNFLNAFSTDIFSQCKLLQYLNIQNNYLTTVDAILYPPSILFINASGNHLTAFNFSNILLLDTIDLNYNKLTKTKDCLNNLPNLKSLYLNYNYIGDSIVTETFEHLKNLAIIEMDKNNLRQFDFKIFNKLDTLTRISLANNYLTSLDFSDFAKYLRKLNLSNNLLHEVKNLSKLKHLTKVELSDNNFRKINYSMFENMFYLRNLWLQNNLISSLELGCFRDLKYLSELNLSYNNITKVLPGVFTGLKSLYRLDISHNNLSNLDEGIFHSTNRLTFLNIAYNNLNDANVKHILSHTPWLMEIDLNGNNWSCMSLANIVRENNYVSLTHGKSFNISNVNGIACNNIDDSVRFDNSQYLRELSLLTNSTVSYTRDISYKMSIYNAVLIISLILFCARLVYVKYFSTLPLPGSLFISL